MPPALARDSGGFRHQPFKRIAGIVSLCWVRRRMRLVLCLCGKQDSRLRR